jgi:nicotinamidase-related amidase
VPAKNHDLHGNVPDSSPVALLLIDVINDLEFPGGDALAEQAGALADRLGALVARAREAGVPVVYANDNFGRWRSDFRQQLEHVRRDGVRGRVLGERLAPAADDYFVLKPKHSGFFATTLDTLLAYLHTRTLVIAGIATNSCVLFTAADAFMRDLRVVVPEDCVIACTPEDHRTGLAVLRDTLHADTRPSDELDFAALTAGQRRAVPEAGAAA